jgi:hypothetical protein
LYDPSIGGAAVDVEFVVRGKVNEAFYCARLDVEWPDTTRTVRESDCPPFAERDASERPPRWTFKRTFPPGEWKVRGCLSKSGKPLSCTEVLVHVVGG